MLEPSPVGATIADQLSVDRLIVEGLVATVGADGLPHLAPMGPLVDRNQTEFVLRPFCTSQTFVNLQRHGHCVFHVTDDVLLLAQAAIGRLSTPPEFMKIATAPGFALADCCRWFALRVTQADASPPRAKFHCAVAERASVRDWFGFNRAKHAIVEAAILATRIGIWPEEEILTELTRLAIPIQKTAGDQERRAISLLMDYFGEKLGPTAMAKASS